MVRRIAMVVGAMLVMGLGAPAGAGPAVSGWVVDNPSPNGVFDAHEGSITVTGVGGDAGGAVTCPMTGGWGRADSGTYRPQDFFGEVGVTSYYSGCSGPGPAGLEVFSSPGTVMVAETYDAAADRIDGVAYPWLWGLFMEAPGCQVDLYPLDSGAAAPLTYDNGTATIGIGPVEVEVTRAEGAGCAGLAAVGDEMTAELTVVATPAFTVHPVP